LEAESIHSGKGKDLQSVDVAWLRKSINTDLSKIKSKVGSKKTLLLAIHRKMEKLKEISIEEHKKMDEKIKDYIL
jgi:hypothetical protein